MIVLTWSHGKSIQGAASRVREGGFYPDPKVGKSADGREGTK